MSEKIACNFYGKYSQGCGSRGLQSGCFYSESFLISPSLQWNSQVSPRFWKFGDALFPDFMDALGWPGTYNFPNFPCFAQNWGETWKRRGWKKNQNKYREGWNICRDTVFVRFWEIVGESFPDFPKFAVKSRSFSQILKTWGCPVFGHSRCFWDGWGYIFSSFCETWEKETVIKILRKKKAYILPIFLFMGLIEVEVLQ